MKFVDLLDLLSSLLIPVFLLINNAKKDINRSPEMRESLMEKEFRSFLFLLNPITEIRKHQAALATLSDSEDADLIHSKERSWVRE